MLEEERQDTKSHTTACTQVIVIPWFFHLYVEIINELKRVDYLTYRWTNIILLFHTTYIRVELAHHEIVRAKVGKGGLK